MIEYYFGKEDQELLLNLGWVLQIFRDRTSNQTMKLQAIGMDCSVQSDHRLTKLAHMFSLGICGKACPNNEWW